jgi:putative ATPase
MTLFRLEPLHPDELAELIERALADSERGLGDLGLDIDPDAVEELGNRTGGDGRQALNSLEVASLLASGDGRSAISIEDVAEALQRRIVRYDKVGDQHYDVISAFIKSVRGSDPDAALYWLFLMLEGGEDPEFIARRLIILASEDIGLADPHALPLAVAAADALAYVGLPEATYHLTEATIYLASAPKSNSVGSAYSRALQDAQGTLAEPVPLHLRNAVTPLMRGMGYGADYKYDHAFEEHYSGQEHLPEKLAGRRYYAPTDQGAEARIKEWLEKLRAAR